VRKSGASGRPMLSSRQKSMRPASAIPSRSGLRSEPAGVR
jgi:hypothetical protein